MKKKRNLFYRRQNVDAKKKIDFQNFNRDTKDQTLALLESEEKAESDFND